MISGALLGLVVMLIIWFANGGGGGGETQLGDDEAESGEWDAVDDEAIPARQR